MKQQTAASTTRPRTLLQALADLVVTRVQRLPPPASSYTVTRDLRIPMRDGVELLADVYTPTGTVKGSFLVRSPYGWELLMAALTGSAYACRGYRVILARCRGTFGSGGTFDAMRQDIADGADTVAWMRKQPWFEGRFATFGGSYLGFTQWALLMDPPPELVTAAISIAPHDFQASVYQGGAFNLVDFLGWSDQMAHQEEPLLRRLLSVAGSGRRRARTLAELPLAEAGERLLAGKSSWYRDWVSRRDPNDPFWSPMQLAQALERVQVPVLLQTGWQDLFLQQTLEQYARLTHRGVDVGLTIGPWTHIEIVTKDGSMMVRETLDWLDEHLAGSAVRARPKPVKVFVTGAAQWRNLDAWPPPTTHRTLYPATAGGLSDQRSPAAGNATFTYDPVDPTPTIGGRILTGGGYTDDSSLAARRDVLSFTGPILGAAIEVFGNPIAELAHVTDNPYADLFVRVSEVDAQGRSRNVSEGFIRLDPAAANGSIRIELDAIAHRFAAGNRIRLLIAGGCHPHWERNLGTSDDPANSARMAPSRRMIDLASSRLVLPVSSA
jgi:putative CocE/NonD family hydrolase